MSQSRNSNREPSRTPRPARIDPSHVPSNGLLSPEEVAALATDATIGPIERVAAASDANSVAVPARAVAWVRQLRTQAAQLARHLDSQQTDLDRRESELNARNASLENEMRSARLWLSERQAELAEREQALRQQVSGGMPANGADSPRLPARSSPAPLATNQAAASASSNSVSGITASPPQIDWEKRQRELDVRQAQLYEDIERVSHERAQLAVDRADVDAKLAKQQEAIERQRQELDAARQELALRQAELEARRSALAVAEAAAEGHAARESDLALRETKLGIRHQEIQTAIARFERLGITEERMADLAETAREFEARRSYLDDAEALLEHQQQELTMSVERLKNDRRAHEEAIRREKAKVATHRAASETELARERDRLRERNEQLDLRTSALEQLRVELARAQQETLQMRLATEELWAQLAGPLAPASLSRSITQLKRKLSSNYQSAEHELEERKADLRVLSGELTMAQSALHSERRELDAWTDERYLELEREAGRLAAREEELDRQSAEFIAMEESWEQERLGYQNDLRRLLARLRATESRTAA